MDKTGVLRTKQDKQEQDRSMEDKLLTIRKKQKYGGPSRTNNNKKGVRKIKYDNMDEERKTKQDKCIGRDTQKQL